MKKITQIQWDVYNKIARIISKIEIDWRHPIARPNNDALPKDLAICRPLRQRHIRLHPKAASIAERQILQDFLIFTNVAKSKFFLVFFSFSFSFGFSPFLNQPAFLYVGIVLSPFYPPFLA